MVWDLCAGPSGCLSFPAGRTKSFTDPTNNPNYIGVPLGEPSEYKLALEWDGWALLMMIQVVIHKIIARINYIHFNILRLTNFTIDAAEGLSSQSQATSIMALQN